MFGKYSSKEENPVLGDKNSCPPIMLDLLRPQVASGSGDTSEPAPTSLVPRHQQTQCFTPFCSSRRSDLSQLADPWATKASHDLQLPSLEI